jgi:CheY-like chemotaxis protein
MQKAILIIDDNPDDSNLIKAAVLSLGPKSPVRTVISSKELREYLEGHGCYADRKAFPYPALILLDLRMPEENGFEVLGWLKRESSHAAIPVIAVSAYDRQREIRKSYELGACTFLSKPVNPISFLSAVRSLRLPIEFSD